MLCVFPDIAYLLYDISVECCCEGMLHCRFLLLSACFDAVYETNYFRKTAVHVYRSGCYRGFVVFCDNRSKTDAKHELWACTGLTAVVVSIAIIAGGLLMILSCRVSQSKKYITLPLKE